MKKLLFYKQNGKGREVKVLQDTQTGIVVIEYKNDKQTKNVDYDDVIRFAKKLFKSGDVKLAKIHFQI